VHVKDRGLLGTQDEAVMAAAAGEHRILVAADTDFGELLALGRHPGPSVVIFRRAPRRPEAQVGLLLAAVAETEHDLLQGAIMVLTPDRARLRVLPIQSSE
jgi:predicted nuclease of predicted toxin-antitoxin system